MNLIAKIFSTYTQCSAYKWQGLFILSTYSTFCANASTQCGFLYGRKLWWEKTWANREQTFIWQKTLWQIQAWLQAFFQMLQAIDGQ